MLGGVRQRILCLLENRKTDLKNEWAQRLRVEPVRTPLADPAILGYLMDETIAQLTALLTRRPPRAKREGGGVFEDRCRCGLNPLLVYFATGEAALSAILETEAPLDEPLRMFVSGQWRVLAQRELDALCGACVRTCPSPYPQVPKVVSSTLPRADECGRDTQSVLRPQSGGKRG